MGSVRRRGDRVRVSLEAGEVFLLGSRTAQVLELLADSDSSESIAPAAAAAAVADPADAAGLSDLSDPVSLADMVDAVMEPVEIPEDPVLRRLLPDAYRDDSEAAKEFRRLTEADLRA